MVIQTMAFFLLALAMPSLANANLEVDVLIAQRAAWSDPNNVLESWDGTLVNPCVWYHVTCNYDNRVIRVDLGDAGLSGPLVPQLGKLKKLQYLELYDNNITGIIPKTLGKLTSLVSLDLYNNQLSGTIPSSIGNLKSLRFLRLNGNKLSGGIPRSVRDLVFFGHLMEMNVSDNYLAGTVGKTHQRVTTITQDQIAAK